jgi:hypothetical protein
VGGSSRTPEIGCWLSSAASWTRCAVRLMSSGAWWNAMPTCHSRLFRGPECRYRVPVGGRPARTTADARCRACDEKSSRACHRRL